MINNTYWLLHNNTLYRYNGKPSHFYVREYTYVSGQMNLTSSVRLDVMIQGDLKIL